MASQRSWGTRFTAGAVALTTALSTATVPATLSPAYAASPATQSDLTNVRGFLERQLKAGAGEGKTYILPGVVEGTTDAGITVDYLLALDALGGDRNLISSGFKRITEKENLDSYLVTVDGDVRITDMNRAAKLVYAAKKVGFESEALTTLANALPEVLDENGRAHEMRSDNSFGEALTNFGQSWVVMALKQEGNTEAAAKAAANLEGQICEDGGLPLYYKVTPDCGNVDPDSSSIAAQAFAYALGKDDAATKSAMGYLRGIQKDNGGFTTRIMAGSGDAVNTNTTALAAGAFVAVEDTESFAKAHSYIESARFGDSTNKTIQGAFAQTPEAVKDESLTDAVRRTTGQAALAFAGHNYIGSTPITSFDTYTPPTPKPQPQPQPQPTPDNTDEGSMDETTGITLGIVGAILAIVGIIAAAMNLPQLKGMF